MIIALTAPQGCGKDTVGGILAKRGFTTMAFADPVRAEIVAAFGCGKWILTDRDEKNREQAALALSHCDDLHFVAAMIQAHLPLPENAPGEMEAWLEQPRSPSWIMQQWGTEYRRMLFGADYWCKQLHERIDATPGDIVITDCRFDNEAEFITHTLNAEIWRITRPGHEPKPGHISEVPVANYWVDRWLANDGDLKELESATLECLAYANHSTRVAA